ncbi:MAG TPA: methyl-accepting chemotaxis protein [Afifellaceae bacterium]|nr:methyl-accepting chemotaxis protein [Afifellaceae bacterium]
MQILSTLGARLVVTVLLIATVAFTAFVSMTIFRLDTSLSRQSAELSALAEEKLVQTLDGAAGLGAVRLDLLFTNVDRQLGVIAQRADIVSAILSGNVVAMTETLRRGKASTDLDGVIIVDKGVNVLGAEYGNIDLLVSDAALKQTILKAEIEAIMAENDPLQPRGFMRVMKMDRVLATALGETRTDTMVLLAIQPVFDDFGDVFAAVVGHRVLRPNEPAIVEFSKIERAELLVLDGSRVISGSLAGDASETLAIGPADGPELVMTSDGKHLARCVSLFVRWRMCALAPISELQSLRGELVRISQREGEALAIWLVVMSVISLLVCGLTAFIAARYLAGPMSQIAQALRAVARGDWKVQVTGTERQDEVGDIARAVSVLQSSMQERDRLKVDVAIAESTNQRRENLEDAIKKFDRSMRSVLLAVTDGVETMDETARTLARISVVAEGEADEAAFVSENTLSSVTAVRNATQKLNTTIVDMAQLLHDMAMAAVGGTETAKSASDQASDLIQASSDLDALVSLTEQILQRASFLAVNATFQATQGDQSAGKDYNDVAHEIEALTRQIARANEELGSRARKIQSATENAAGAMGDTFATLNDLVERTNTIVRSIEKQRRVTSEIDDSMSMAATGSSNVSSSVQRLKATVGEARNTSMQVVTKAVDMADEARRLDTTVKNFLREVNS